MTASVALGMSRRVGAELRAALALLTRVPVAAGTTVTSGAAAFGLVGALVGAVGGSAILIVADASPLAGAGVALAAMALVTGALHLDGLADTFDALAAAVPEAAERARRDPRIGAVGATALVLVLIVDAAVLADLVVSGGVIIGAAACVAAASASRVVPVAVALVGPGTANGGSGDWFVRSVVPRHFVAAAGSAASISLAASVVVGVALVPALAFGFGLAVAIVVVVARRRGAVDGDLLGAGVEAAFAFSLLFLVLIA